MARFKISSRSKWKGVYSKVRLKLHKRILDLRKLMGVKSIFKYIRSVVLLRKLRKIQSRSSVILPTYVGRTQQVTRGSYFTVLRITNDHIGHRFGEFNLTTKKSSAIHRNNAKTKKNKTKK